MVVPDSKMTSFDWFVGSIVVGCTALVVALCAFFLLDSSFVVFHEALGAMEGEWVRIAPPTEIRGVEGGGPVLSAERFSLSWDALSVDRAKRPRWGEVYAEGVVQVEGVVLPVRAVYVRRSRAMAAELRFITEEVGAIDVAVRKSPLVERLLLYPAGFGVKGAGARGPTIKLMEGAVMYWRAAD